MTTQTDYLDTAQAISYDTVTFIVESIFFFIAGFIGFILLLFGVYAAQANISYLFVALFSIPIIWFCAKACGFRIQTLIRKRPALNFLQHEIVCTVNGFGSQSISVPYTQITGFDIKKKSHTLVICIVAKNCPHPSGFYQIVIRNYIKPQNLSVYQASIQANFKQKHIKQV